MKKFFAILISILLVLSLNVVAFAGEGDPPAAPTGHTITIANGVDGETYNAYTALRF